MKNKVAYYWYIVLCALALAGCGQEKEKSRQGNVRGGDLLYLKDYVVLHGDSKQYLYVGKKKYYGVKGEPPYYLSITNTSKIFFVTKWDKKVIFHIVDPKNGEDIQIDGENSTFGNGIGLINNINADRSQYISQADSNHIVLENKRYYGDSGTIEKTIISIKKRKIDRREEYEYDGKWNLTNLVIYKDGTITRTNKFQ